MGVRYRTGWEFTDHALRRMDEMGVLADEVHRTIGDPDLRYPSYDGPDGQPRQVRVRDRLVVIVSPEDSIVVTVLWNHGEGRTHLPPAA